MEETRKIQCSCGQENQLVFLAGMWRYDIDRHGNGEPCEGRCFNCHAPLKDEKIFPPEVKEAPATAAEPEAAEGPKEVSMLMTKKELLAVANSIGVEVPTTATKAEIIELIEAKENEGGEPGEDEAQEPEDE